MRTYRRTGTQRVSGSALSSCHPSSSSEGPVLLLCQHLQTLPYLSGIALYDDVSARVCSAPVLVSLRPERLAETAGTDVLRQAPADDLHGAAHGHELAGVMLTRTPEEHVNQLLLYLGRLERPVVHCQLHDLLL